MKKSRIAAALMACLLATVSSAATARAEGDDYSTIIESVQVKKYLVMKKGVSAPSVTFRYTLAPGQAVAGTEGTYEIKAGPAGAVFAASNSTALTVSFTPDDSLTAEASAPSGSTIQFATADTSDEAYAEKTLTVDLSRVTFPAAGIYRYVVTEQASGMVGITSDSVNKRYLDIFVHKSDRTDEDTYDPGSAVIRVNSGAPDADGNAGAAVKSTGFTNRYDTDSLRFSKSVTGNQASGNQYFRFTVKLTGARTSGDGDTRMGVDGTFDAQPAENMATVYDAEVMAQANDGVEYVTLEQLRSGKDFYIKGGQTVLLTGIPRGMGYTVTAANEDYEPSVEITGDTEGCTVDGGSVTDSSLTQDTVLAFLNARNDQIPSTGVTAAFAIPAAALLTGLAGLVLLAARRIRKRASEGNGIE